MKYDLNLAKTAHNSTMQLLNKNYFFNSAVLIPIYYFKNDPYILFEVRSEGIRQPGEVCFPGGKIDETDKNFRDAAIRETMEELNLTRRKIKFTGNLGTFVNITGVYVEAFIGELKIKNIDEIGFNKKEVARIFSLPVSYFVENAPEKYSLSISLNPKKKNENGDLLTTFPAEKLNLPSRYNKERQISGYPVYVYETEFGVIWGITAYLLKEFIARITEKY